MSLRTRILLFAGMAFGLVASMGGVLFHSGARARELRRWSASMDQQLAIYTAMQGQAWNYLGHMLHAGRMGADTRAILREHEQSLQEDFEKLQQGLVAEQPWEGAPQIAAEQQLLQSLLEARRQWAQGAEVVLRPSSSHPPLGPESWWELLASYEQEVNPLIQKTVALRREKRLRLQSQLDRELRRAQRVGVLVPAGAGLVLGLMAVLLMRPIRREIRELRARAERIRGGDFTAELPITGGGELGSLAQALNRMAQELRDSLREKERMLKAEAEAAERERRQEAETAARDFMRYNAALEQMVRARTAELENLNAQLASSLRQQQTMQAQLILSDRLVAMGKLAAGVGHEINNPLAYVLSNLNYLHKELQRTEGMPTEEERRELLTAVSEAKEGADRVRIIVQDLKTLSRPDDVSGGKADLKEVVRAAVKIASHEIRRRARLVEELGEVPPVLGSGSRLGQVFLNLLINAAHAIPEGRVEENEIRVVARPDGENRVVVEIRDTGCGIPRENLERIFDPFFTTKPVGEGTGLGLALVHSIITALGGVIAVESELNRGTTFRVTLPSAKSLN